MTISEYCSLSKNEAVRLSTDAMVWSPESSAQLIEKGCRVERLAQRSSEVEVLVKVGKRECLVGSVRVFASFNH